jgi:hypothetical protein
MTSQEGDQVGFLDESRIMQETSVDETEPQIESVPTETQKSTVWHTVSISISCFFITVATVLGTGILALPVKVAKTGFFPFLTTVVTCLVAQVFIIIYMIELLQRTQALMNTKKKCRTTRRRP